MDQKPAQNTGNQQGGLASTPSGNSQQGNQQQKGSQPQNQGQKNQPPLLKKPEVVTASTSYTTVLIWVVLIVLVLLSGWWLTRKPASDTTKKPTTSTSTVETNETSLESSGVRPGSGTTGSGSNTAPVAVLPSTDVVMVSNQPAGASVTVTSLKLTGVSWIAVHDSKDWVLGAARLEPGTHTNALIPLLRNTVKGEAYRVVLYVDDGDKLFDFKKDRRTSVAMPFTAE